MASVVWAFHKTQTVGSIPALVGANFTSNGKLSTAPPGVMQGVTYVIHCLVFVQPVPEDERSVFFRTNNST